MRAPLGAPTRTHGEIRQPRGLREAREIDAEAMRRLCAVSDKLFNWRLAVLHASIMSYMHPPRLLRSALPLLLFVLTTNAQDDNLLRNPTFQISTPNGTVPDNWSLHGDGFASGLQGTTTKAMALKSVDPNTPSILFQSVPTLNSLDYRLTFDAFTTDADKGQQNLTVDFGVGTWAVQPPGHWLFYTFSVRGKGSDDVLKFSAWDTSGGAVYIYNLALVSLGADNSPSPTQSSANNSPSPIQSSTDSSPSPAQTSAAATISNGGPSVLPAVTGGGGSSALSKGALIATICSPIVTLIAAILAWWKREEVKSCYGRSKA